MGHVNLFEITLHNDKGVYSSAQYIFGHCTVELNEVLPVFGIRLKFEGKAHVEWSVKEFDSKYPDVFKATEKYLSHEVLLFGSFQTHGCKTVDLDVGRHIFPFTFLLPSDLPSSFEGDFGSVRYFIKCVIEKPERCRHVAKRQFCVAAVVDLNKIPSTAIPVECRNQKPACCLCWEYDAIVAVFRLGRTGFVPGETIRLFADIINRSIYRINSTFVNLKMKTTYHANGESRSLVKEVSRVTEGPIEKNEEFFWGNQELVLPPLLPTRLGNCTIIDVEYILQLNVVSSGPISNLKVPIEITVGTIPFRRSIGFFESNEHKKTLEPIEERAYSPNDIVHRLAIISDKNEPFIPHQKDYDSSILLATYGDSVDGSVNDEDEVDKKQDSVSSYYNRDRKSITV